MNKEIEKAKSRLDDLKKERERKEVRYNSHAIIVEGHRETMKILEDRSRVLLDELTESNSNVGKQQILLNEMITKFQEEVSKENEDER